MKAQANEDLNKVKLLTLKGCALEYACWGNPQSDTVFLCLHGFGRTYKDFMQFENLAKSNFFVGVNIFYHGKSMLIDDKLPLSKKDWASIISKLLDELGLEKVSLMAYSMGGKFALTLIEEIPDKIEGMVLLAPDGLRMNKGYWFATRTAFGVRTTRYFVESPNFFYRPLFWLKKMKLIDEKTSKFLEIQGENRDKRVLVEQVWSKFKQINPDLTLVAKNQIKYQIPALLLFGKYDRIIPSSKAKKYKQLLGDLAQVLEIPCGHLMYNEKVERVLRDYFS